MDALYHKLERYENIPADLVAVSLWVADVHPTCLLTFHTLVFENTQSYAPYHRPEIRRYPTR